MNEIRTEIKVVQVDKICKECNWGRMRPTGMAYMSNPLKYPHACDRCGHEEIYLVRYPNTEMVPV